MRGDVYRLRARRDAVGHEQRGARYAVVLQTQAIATSTLIVAPTSTSAAPGLLHPKLDMGGTPTVVLVEQMGAVDGQRLGDFAGRVDPGEWTDIERAVRVMLGLL
ncbi:MULTISPECIES: type II toxin-antitoxin system PemK/MazF family toxin [Streptomyces]|uniref:PemK-like protein n=2 Tax=Streptomyces TaxID=1883 RepID=A0A1D8G6C3_9ACTN|nr:MULTISPECIES: type II toxin-antitoxin system PemK/MazF family toxin [Streptomyces]AOT60968.1 PemK-like protein [Streptomyces rubrolavendulae]UQS30737.1 type II toxin-antitoxin system PemK/MazF family toxin [Streptomyces fradiae]KAF0651396.1 growth inhibitor PemK [Streptomyces fradiae ATCC 10745 = DSM 40063]OSY49527.1 PemK-like protein [Streptomyces fradiae ATCC 10745 = DSM 40063]QEV14029.1 type II toxin-antitoxin system PemK/MazF family toxin [Streptomyces fradiae ATCC 10745 = DSM 40063]